MDENWDLTMARVSRAHLSAYHSYTAHPVSQIVPHVNGVNSIRVISILADTDFSLTCRAIRHLLYYNCILLLDIFSFSAIYAPTAQFGQTIASSEAMQQECARYVNTRFAPVVNMAPSLTSDVREFSSPQSQIPPTLQGANDHPSGPVTIWPLVGGGSNNYSYNKNGTDKRTKELSRPKIVDGVGIAELYASLRQGQSLKQWYARNSDKLANIDIRRFITFGIIKGFLYRVHKYAYETGQPAPTRTESSRGGAINKALKNNHTHNNHNNIHPSSAGDSSYGSYIEHHYQRKRTGSNESMAADSPPPRFSRRAESPELQASSYRSGFQGHDSFEQSYDRDIDNIVDEKTLSKYLDGVHCFDQICTELEMSEKELTARLKRHLWEVVIIHR